ncbi:MAG: hypothetical protein V1886_01085 [archaeon]
MKFKRKLGIGILASLLSLGVGCGTADYSNKTSIQKNKEETQIVAEHKQFPEIFDYKNQTFYKLSGGIDEGYLGKFLTEEKMNNSTLSFYQKVDEQERELEFHCLQDFEGSISQIESLITAINNLKLIREGDRANIYKLKEEYIPLKVLLDKLNRVYHKKLAQQTKLKELYEIISAEVKSGEATHESLPLEKLVQGAKGDCNDLSPAFFSLLNYYGIKTYLRCGKVIDKGEEGLHEWISVEIDNTLFDLDPTWYGSFCPLEDRNKKIKHSSLKEEHMIFKKNE